MVDVELGWDPEEALGCCLDEVRGQVQGQGLIQVLEQVLELEPDRVQEREQARGPLHLRFHSLKQVQQKMFSDGMRLLSRTCVHLPQTPLQRHQQDYL